MVLETLEILCKIMCIFRGDCLRRSFHSPGEGRQSPDPIKGKNHNSPRSPKAVSRVCARNSNKKSLPVSGLVKQVSLAPLVVYKGCEVILIQRPQHFSEFRGREKALS